MIQANEQCLRIFFKMKLTKAQREAVAFLARTSLRQKFYWTGGTLLACHYLHHRRSLDLDFFSEKRFSFTEVNDWGQRFKKKVGFKKVTYRKVFDRFEFLFENKEELRIEFVYYNREKKTLRKRRKLLGLYIDSLEDIAANKVMAFLDRNEPKDLFDLYFLLTKKDFALKKLLRLACQKFGVEFSEDFFYSEIFKGLPLLREVRPLMIEKSKREKENLLREIENYFREKSNRYLRKLLK